MTRITDEAPPTGGHTLERLPQVKARTGLARSTIYRMIACGEFPKNLKLTGRCSAWDAAEVDAWIAAKIAARDSAALAASPGTTSPARAPVKHGTA